MSSFRWLLRSGWNPQRTPRHGRSVSKPSSRTHVPCGLLKPGLARLPFSLPMPLDGPTWSCPAYGLLDRGTLTAVVSRLSRKWHRLRESVFSRVPCDSPQSHVKGQLHMFWSARLDEAVEHRETYKLVQSLPETDRIRMAWKYLNRRKAQAAKARDDSSGSHLPRVQAAALWLVLDDFSLTPARATVLAHAEYRRKRFEKPERKIRTTEWVGGAPNPIALTSERQVSTKWKRAQSNAERLAALCDDAPFPPTAVARLDGRLELPSGCRPQKFVLPGGPALEFIRERRPSLLKWLGPSDACVGGSWDTSKWSFEVACQPNKGSGHAGDLYRALSSGYKDLKLGRLPQPSIRALECVKVNGRAYPGIFSSRIGNNRKTAYGACVEIAKQHYLDARERFEPDLSLWACGGRGKPSQMVQVGDRLKSRLILMPETPSALLESAFAQPFTAMLSAVRGDIMIGASMTDRGFRRVLSPVEDAHHVKAFDWSGFDSRVREDMIVTAFGIVRACFKGDDAWLDNVFLRFISHFLVKRVVTPGGWLYTLANGVPSGSPFTSIIDSLVNWLVITDLEICMGGLSAPTKNRRRVYGDDFMQAFFAPCLERDAYIALAFERWGFVAKPSAALEGVACANTADASLPFLSFRFPFGLPARPIQDALKIGLLPQKARYSYSAQAARVCYLDHFAPYDPETIEYHREYFNWLQTKIPGMTWADGRPQPDLVSPWIHKAMVNFVAAGFAPGVVSLGEWFRQEDPRRWPDRWVPRRCGRLVPRAAWSQGKLQSALSTLRWGNCAESTFARLRWKTL
ncbi:RNA-dependent RNA polymerase [Ustilaginoidea virens nonsegmented virus 2]|uniref:RNA-dependent RNA polymerase n=1 Tax=Ustilaginoidea virens nonsegmented virus 2 TaxID=2305465 RepID=UPI000E9B56DD|nr:RNA-dependent RNA polymerase [Ustilaginoidea virens nonsegmented virus 2]AXR76113.1 RNA-dependent RNA polymerase [Ustilaginoidea virens nonsegmented virus 2]